MANPLTGDYGVLLQVSGSTVDRLVATMHQNAGYHPSLPSIPHCVGLRLGDDDPIDDVRGRMWVQVGAPRIDLINGVDDRFLLQVDIRARYVPDPDAEPLADFIYGSVAAEYRLEDIDPSCPGWRQDAKDYLWFRVIDESVVFEGTVANDTSPVGIVAPLDTHDVLEKVTRQLRALLKGHFAPKPHKVSERFRRGSMVTLHPGPGDSAVAIPLEGGGQLTSIGQVVTEGRHLALAISSDYILSKVQPMLDNLRATFVEHIHYHSVTTVDLGLFDVDVLTIDIKYTVTLDSATATWTGGTIFGMSAGLITVHITGAARTQKAQYNIGFDVTVQVIVTFDAASEGLQLAQAGAPAVTLNYGGPFSTDVKNAAQPQIQSQVAAQVNNVLAQASGQFSMADRKDDLIDQLKTIDANAGAWFDDAQFSPDGVVLLGSIPLSQRRKPAIRFDKTDELDGYTAYESWFPGGRIDEFKWSWSWSGGTHPPGSQGYGDRFLLRRAPGYWSKYGVMTSLGLPLPGIDGFGTMCLYLEGAQVDAWTGDLVSAGVRRCKSYEWNIRVAIAELFPDLLLRDWAARAETGLLAVPGRGSDRVGANTLVLYAGEKWTEDLSSALTGGLAGCERNDAGLIVLVLFRDGLIGSGGAPVGQLQELAADLPAPLLVNEDVRGGWSEALGLDGSSSWRLISPTGGVSWSHDGSVGAEELAKGLDLHLFPSGPPIAEEVGPELDLGSRVSPADWIGGGDSNCPPPPVGTGGGGGRRPTEVAFVQLGSESSETRLRRLVEGSDSDTAIVVVVNRATPEEAQRLGSSLGGDAMVVPDTSGAITAGAGVRYWPTTVSLNEVGIVVGHEVGLGDGETSKEEGA